MKKHFYTHLIDIYSINQKLDELYLHNKHKDELILIVYDNIHHIVIETILDAISHEEDKESLLIHIENQSHDEVWALLNVKVTNAEKIILSAVELFKKELLEDISELKKLSKK